MTSENRLIVFLTLSMYRQDLSSHSNVAFPRFIQREAQSFVVFCRPLQVGKRLYPQKSQMK